MIERERKTNDLCQSILNESASTHKSQTMHHPAEENNEAERNRI